MAASFAGASVVDELLPLLVDAVARVVLVGIVVGKQMSPAPRSLPAVVDRLRGAGRDVAIRQLKVSGVALMDGKVSWYGSLPLLAKPKEGDCALRIVSAEVAAGIATMLASDG